MEYYKDRIRGILDKLDKNRRTNRIAVTGIRKKDIGYGERETCFNEDGVWNDFDRNETWGGHETHAAFKTVITIPKEYAGKKVAVTLNTGATDIWNTDNPQFLVYINGKIICGHDMNHNEVILCKEAIPGDKYEYALYAYSNGADARDFLLIDTVIVQDDVEELYYDILVPYDIACLMKNTDKLQNEYLTVLNDAVSILDLRNAGSDAFHESVKKCDEFIKKYIYDEKTSLIERDPISNVIVSSVGHTHIDVAWKWPLRQTREKVIRSFSTVLYEMDRYPEYKFMSSQPQLYEFVKEESPEIYSRIKERVAEGRWETEGAMWLEADCNLASGESLIRQILFGTSFFKEEFGTSNNRVLWLPDVFGYSAAMPQILKKSRIDYFMTTKLGWNEFNQIPNDTFLWKGIDGTEVLTYLITTKDYITDPELNKKRTAETTYNGRENANQIMGCWQRYQNKDINENVLTCFGHGDGGGGATISMLEEARRLQHTLPGCPRVKMSHVLEFFDELNKNLKGKKVPKWNGELYLEYHRGTYTSMARNKKYNRKCEIRNEDAESMALYAFLMGAASDYPFSEIKECWKKVLLNQFHDILPGSSIEDVYIDSLRQYTEVWNSEQHIIDDSLTKIVKKNTDNESLFDVNDNKNYLYVFNNTSFERTDTVTIDGCFGIIDPETSEILTEQHTSDFKTVFIAKNIPQKGYKVYEITETRENTVSDSGNFAEFNRGYGENYGENDAGSYGENDSEIYDDKKRDIKISTAFYDVKFDKNLEIVSLFDKENNREIIKKGFKGNRLAAFEDIPKEYDAWNIDKFYVEKSWDVHDTVSAEIIEDGDVFKCLKVVKRFNNSVITQKIYFYNNLRRIDFKTEIDWNESQVLLKTYFPVDVVANKATYEIQYGNVERATHENTSWDAAKYEVCAHKWADISENGYGIALMNDCKYGYSGNETTMSLTLIKSGIFPNPHADREHHEFTYSILPHKGDFRTGDVIKESYFLNYPVYTLFAKKPEEHVKSFFNIDSDSVILEVVKPMHSEKGTIVKIDETENLKTEQNVSVILRLYESFGGRAAANLSSCFEIVSAFECDMLEYTTRRLNLNENKVSLKMNPYEIKTVKLIIKKEI